MLCRCSLFRSWSLPPGRNEVSVRATPAQGASITEIIVYDNNAQVAQTQPGDTELDSYGLASGGGTNDFVVNAWDTEGHLYQAKSSVYFTGFFGTCPTPKSPGINLCVPPADTVPSTDPLVGVASTGQSTITNISFDIGGKLITSIPNSVPQGNSFGFATDLQIPGQDTPYTVTTIATDSSGHAYSANNSVTGEYTYGAYSCAPKGNQCYPGINVIAPTNQAYVGSTFNLNAQIVGNPKPITTLKAYIDDSVYATSTNAPLQHEIFRRSQRHPHPNRPRLG